MSKAVRWQVPFVSVSGTKYRVDIYDETGSWSGVTQLLAGDTPFVTDEDASDDYFAPVRSQSGTLQVCTKIEPQTTYPSGGTLSLNDILPANNIAHPVRLVSIAANNAETIEWQGFLSCEAYNQDYVGIPQNLSLSIISVLEAMDSVKVNPLYFTGVKAGNTLLYYTLRMIEMEVGMTIVQNVAYSYAAWEILSKYFDTDLFFENKEYINESTINYTIVGISCKELLERICKFMGWTARENGTTIYFQRMTEEVGMYKQSLSSLNDSNWSGSSVRTLEQLESNALASDIEWRGDGHQKSVVQGAKSVEVVAHIEQYDADMALPDFPGSDPTSDYTKTVEDYNGGSRRNLYIQNILEQNLFANNIMAYSFHQYKFYLGEHGYVAQYIGESTLSSFISNAFLRKEGAFMTADQNIYYAGATFIRYAVKSSQGENPSRYEQGLYCGLMPGLKGVNTPSLFSLRNPNQVSLPKGTLNINISMEFLGYCATRQWLSGSCYSKDINAPMQLNGTLGRMAIQVGKWWWTGLEWSETSQGFDVEFTGSGVTVSVPVGFNIFGEMKIHFFPGITCVSGSDFTNNQSVLFEVLINSLQVTFTPNSSISQMDKRENNYLTILSTNFRDEISIRTELATNNNNIDSPSLVIADASSVDPSRYVQKIDYHTTQTSTSSRRPEVDLLNRLAAYYGAARQRLELEVAHPTAAPLPLLKLNGINDGKVYLPLSESRDWQTGVCKLTCFETPT